MHQDSINFGDKVPRKMCDKSLSLNSIRLKISKFNKPVSQKKIRNLKNRLVWAPSEHNLLKPSGHSPWKFRTASIRITCPSTRKWKSDLIGCWTAPQRLFHWKQYFWARLKNESSIWLAVELLFSASAFGKKYFWVRLKNRIWLATELLHSASLFGKSILGSTQNVNYSNIITIRNCRLAMTYVFSTYQGYQDLDNDVVYHG